MGSYDVLSAADSGLGLLSGSLGSEHVFDHWGAVPQEFVASDEIQTSGLVTGYAPAGSQGQQDAAAQNAAVLGLGEAQAEGGDEGLEEYILETYGYDVWDSLYNTPVGETACFIEMADPSTWGDCAPYARLDPYDLISECGNVQCGSCSSLTRPMIDEAVSTLHLIMANNNVFDNPLEDIFGGFGFSPDFDAEKDMIEQAWTVLRQNRDVITWAACYVEETVHREGWFDTNLGACLLRKLDNPMGTTIVLSDVHACEQFADAFACTYIDPLWLFQEAIHLTRSGAGHAWDDYLRAFEDNEMCGAIALAGSLLHELWHMCREFRFEDSGELGACADPVLLENLFRWVMYQRCPSARQSPCCKSEWCMIEHPYNEALVYPCNGSTCDDSSSGYTRSSVTRGTSNLGSVHYSF